MKAAHQAELDMIKAEQLAKDAEHADNVAKAQMLLEAHKQQVAAEKAEAEARAAKL